MPKILSILICSLFDRSEYLAKLHEVLRPQITDEVEVKLCIDNGELTTGHKRNELLNASKGKYTVFIDDDDLVSDTYVRDILEAAKQETDAIVFNGWITTNGKDKKRFELSKEFNYETKDDVYYRYPNHIVPIKSTISKQFKFPNIRHGEDYKWATKIHKSGLIKTETKIDKDLYFYLYRTK